MGMGFEGVLEWIARSWICRRDPRDTHQDDVKIEEINSDTRLRNSELLEDDMDELMESEQFADIWKSIWPETGAGWKEEWQSIPLTNIKD